jgi:ligand-binding SRPBCC domain-containing protein
VADLSLERRQLVPASPEATFAFFGDPRNLQALTPPWLRFRILEAPQRLQRGSRLVYRLRLYGVPIRWRTEIEVWRPPRTFTDVQLAGPYALWVHTHRFTPAGAGTEVYDHVRYRIPFGPLGRAVNRVLVRRWLDDIFAYRAARLADSLGRV